MNYVQLNNVDLQFHPESIATCYGAQIFKNFKEITYNYWLRFGSSSHNRGKYAHSAGNLKNFVNTNTLYHMCLSDCFGSKIIWEIGVLLYN